MTNTENSSGFFPEKGKKKEKPNPKLSYFGSYSGIIGRNEKNPQ